MAATTAQAVSRRDYDPFGVRVAAAGTWPDDKGFLGKVADGSTGLDLLGARQYNPATGSFLSLDPVLEAGSPTEMGGYAYAGNNPATTSDPTGLQPPPADLSCDNPVTDDPACGNHTGPTSSGGTTSGGGGGGGHGPGSPSPPPAPCWWGGFSVASCAHANANYTPQYLAALAGPSKPAPDLGLCKGLAAQLFMGMTISGCSPGLNPAATGNDGTGTGDGGGKAWQQVNLFWETLANAIGDAVNGVKNAQGVRAIFEALKALRGTVGADVAARLDLDTETYVGTNAPNSNPSIPG